MTDKIAWSVVTTTTTAYTDGSQSVEVRKQSASEHAEAPEQEHLNPMERDGSWDKKFLFNYAKKAPGNPDALIGLPGEGQSPGYDKIWGENWELPPGWVLNRGSSSGRMYLSGYDEDGDIIFMEFPQIPSDDPTIGYSKGDPSKVRPASQ